MAPPSSLPPLFADEKPAGSNVEYTYTRPSYRSHRRTNSKTRRSPIGTLLCILTLVGLAVAVITLFWSRGQTVTIVDHPIISLDNLDNDAVEVLLPPSSSEPAPASTPVTVPPLDPWKSQLRQWVVGEPTTHFQDNLRSDTRYVTTWVSGGWTNDFMTYINMIYVGLQSSRVPILPPFAPSHVAYEAGFPPFGDIFDVPRLAAAINAPLLEWRDIKDENSTEFDQIGCWSIWGTFGSEDGSPRNSIVPQRLHLDVAYTNIPSSSPIIHSVWLPFWSLIKLGFPERHAISLSESHHQTPAPRSGVILPPDERLMCFDFMYYVGAQEMDEWWDEWSPAWNLVGRWARWEPRLEALAIQYIRKALEYDEGDDVPPYISVHIRRGDFTAACGNSAPDDCFPSLSDYARRVADVAGTLFAKKSIDLPVHNVLVTSDESDSSWWAEVNALGWRRIDHRVERTEELFGKWYPPLLDAVAQSMAVGFVGTDRSTMSLVAMRRVKDWNGGIAEMVRIGNRR